MARFSAGARRAILVPVGIFSRLLGSWSLAGVARPWPTGPSIWQHLRAHTDASSGKLLSAGTALPDESEQAPERLRWAPGALDGVFGHHAGRDDDDARVASLSQALGELLQQASAERLRKLYELATREPLLGIVDKLTDALRAMPKVAPARVHEVATVLAREAPQREAVKLGLALIGLIDVDDTELIVQLGLHDEFTLFATVALVNQNQPGAERALFRLAQCVDGWGRIQVVERLASTHDPEIQGWLLRDGFRNSIMDEYLACTCAVAGKLHVALTAEVVDDALLYGAAGILLALAIGGPAQDLADYPHVAETVAAFLKHVEARPLDLELLTTLDGLVDRSEVPEPLRARLEALRHGPQVQPLIDAGLAATDPVAFFRANNAARERNIDTFAVHERRVRAGDLDASLASLMQAATATSIELVLDAVAPHVPLTTIASGPREEMGLGPEYRAHGHLDVVVQGLARFPGKGAAFVGAALQSPVIRNRYGALRTLATWTPARWSEGLRAALSRAIEHEPNDALRTAMQRVLAGGPVQEPAAEDDAQHEEEEEPSPAPVLH